MRAQSWVGKGQDGDISVGFADMAIEEKTGKSQLKKNETAHGDIQAYAR